MRRSQLMADVQEKFKSLSRKQRRQVLSAAQYDPDSRYWLRCRIVRLLSKGHGPGEIQNFLECSSSTITRVARAFLEAGPDGLTDGRQFNGQRKIDEQIDVFLLECAAGSPQDYLRPRPTWTLEVFALVLKTVKEITVSLSALSRAFARLKIRLKRGRPFVACPWGKRRKNKHLKEIARLVESVPDDEVVLYVDEIDIHLNPKIGPDWMPLGIQKRVATPGQNQKHYLAGALNSRTGRVTFVESTYKDSYLFIDQLWTLVQRDYPDAKRIHLILDNYCIHSSGLTQIAVDALSDRISLHFLPPYCPDHNRIERFWKDLHAAVTRNHTCATMEELMANVRHYIHERNLQLGA